MGDAGGAFSGFPATGAGFDLGGSGLTTGAGFDLGPTDGALTGAGFSRGGGAAATGDGVRMAGSGGPAGFAGGGAAATGGDTGGDPPTVELRPFGGRFVACPLASSGGATTGGT